MTPGKNLQRGTYLWGILGQWDILLLNLISVGFTNFLDLSFFTNADVVTIKDATNGGKIKEQDVPLT